MGVAARYCSSIAIARWARLRGSSTRAQSRHPLSATREYDPSMAETFDFVDYDVEKGWHFSDERTAVRYAAAGHAATGAVVEVVRLSEAGEAQHLVLPPNAPIARPSPNQI